MKIIREETSWKLDFYGTPYTSNFTQAQSHLIGSEFKSFPCNVQFTPWLCESSSGSEDGWSGTKFESSTSPSIRMQYASVILDVNVVILKGRQESVFFFNIRHFFLEVVWT